MLICFTNEPGGTFLLPVSFILVLCFKYLEIFTNKKSSVDFKLKYYENDIRETFNEK